MIRIHNPHPLPFLQQTEIFLRSGTLCDTVLIVEGHIFKAHALILSWASKNLKRQLTNQNPGKGYSCMVHGVTPHIVKQILDFMYGAWVDIPRGDLPDLLKGAQHLEVQSLIEQCQLQMDVQEEVKGANVTFSPNDDLRDHDSRKKFPSSSEALSSFSEPSLVTHCSQKSQGVSITIPPPQKSPFPITVTPPVYSREQISTKAPYFPPSQNPSLCWPALNSSHPMLLRYSDLMAVQRMVAYSYPTSMYPFRQHSFQLQLPPSLLAYSGLLHTNQSLLCPRPLTLGNPLAPDLKENTKSIKAALPIAGSHEQKRKQKDPSEWEIVYSHCEKSSGTNCRQNSRSAKTGLDESIPECKFCLRRTRVKRSLQSLRRSLGEEKPYQCKNCSKRFSLKHQLDTHLRVHTGEKPFECRLCGQRSRDYSAMIKHLRTHGGATPYQCTMCLEFCSSLATMQKHLKGHPSQDFPQNWNLSSTYLYTCHT